MHDRKPDLLHKQRSNERQGIARFMNGKARIATLHARPDHQRFDFSWRIGTHSLSTVAWSRMVAALKTTVS